MAERTPEGLVREMRRMADLHPQTIWALAMRDGAEMIERLMHEMDEIEREARKAGYQEGMAGAKESSMRDDAIEAARRARKRCKRFFLPFDDELANALDALEAVEANDGDG